MFGGPQSRTLLEVDPVKVLECADSVHDFYRGYRGTIPGATAALPYIHNSLLTNIKKIVPGVPDPTGVAMQESHFLSILGISSAGDFESSVVNAYNKSYFNITGTTLIDTSTTMSGLNKDHIISITDSELTKLTAEQIDLLLRLNPKVIEIDRNLLKGATLSSSDQEKLEEFILKYLVGTGYDSTVTHFTFDANNADIKRIMKNSSYVRGLKTPQNIADSAITSSKDLSSERDDWYYCPKDPGSTTFNATQNTFTRGDIVVQYKENDDLYTKETPFNFVQAIGSRSRGGLIGIIPFSKQMSSGPSLDYLAQCVTRAATTSDFSGIGFRSQSPFAANASQTPAGFLIPGPESIPTGDLFFDIKRLGDHEQVRAAVQFKRATGLPTVFCTIDKVCSVYARLNNLPCAVWSKEKLTLYRMGTGSVQTGSGYNQAGGLYAVASPHSTSPFSTSPTFAVSHKVYAAAKTDVEISYTLSFMHEMAGIAATYVNSFICEKNPTSKLYALLHTLSVSNPADTLYRTYLNLQIQHLASKLGLTDANDFVNKYQQKPISTLRGLLTAMNSESNMGDSDSRSTSLDTVRKNIVEEYSRYINEYGVVDTSSSSVAQFAQILTASNIPSDVVIYALAVLSDILSDKWDSSLFNLPMDDGITYLIPKGSNPYSKVISDNGVSAIAYLVEMIKFIGAHIYPPKSGGARRTHRRHRKRRVAKRKTRQTR